MKRPSAPPYGERVLRHDPPSEGRDVWELQIKLIAWGSGSNNDGIGAPLMPVLVTGKFDRATHDAVKRFQHMAALPMTGIVDAHTFRAIDREPGQYAVMVHPLRCPCIKPDPIPIQCRCTDHHKKGICSGFGNGLFAGKFLLDGVKLPDGASLSSEKLDVYDMQEYPGIDKALLWAVRGLMRRANVDRIKVVAGYRCWQDNYRHTDWRRWRHRKATFHFGKSVEFYHDDAVGGCTEWGQNANVLAACVRCQAIRQAALDLCGFQPRWQEPDRVSVGEVANRVRVGDPLADAPQPANTFAVHVSTVRRRDREKDEFVKTYADSVKPIYQGKAAAYSYPVDLGGGRDWQTAGCLDFFRNTEGAAGGWFPFGPNRLWHTGIHLFQAAASPVYAIADGEVVACRAGENETAQPFGSRNFVLLRHKLKDQIWYSLYMHLDNGAIGAASALGPAPVKWRRKASMLTLDHVEMKLPSPFFEILKGGTPDSYLGGLLAPALGTRRGGLGPGEWAPINNGGNAADPTAGGLNAIDGNAPQNSTIIQTAMAAPLNPYVFLTLEGQELGEIVRRNGGLVGPIGGNQPFGLSSPIPVEAGELLGAIAAAPTNAALNAHGSYLHLETFSERPLLSGAGYATVDATSVNSVMDRTAIYQSLRGSNLISAEPADVLLQSDMTAPGIGINRAACRSAILKTRSPWNENLKMRLNSSATFGFMPDGDRNTLGDQMNQYRWWSSVAGDANLPDPSSLYYYHPIALMLQLASIPSS
jgi:hypothetical protein